MAVYSFVSLISNADPISFVTLFSNNQNLAFQVVQPDSLANWYGDTTMYIIWNSRLYMYFFGGEVGIRKSECTERPTLAWVVYGMNKKYFCQYK